MRPLSNCSRSLIQKSRKAKFNSCIHSFHTIYDAAGNERAFTTAKQGRFESELDATGHAAVRRLPSGTVLRYERNARGKTTKQYDNRGHGITFERDAGGATTGVVLSNGIWIRAKRDDAGRIIEMKTSAGKVRRFAYDARGSLTDYTDAQGGSKHFEYSRKGLLQTITDDKGTQTNIERDKHGKRISALVTDKHGTLSKYDGNGNLLAVSHSAQSVKFENAGFISTAVPLRGADCMFGNGDGWFPGDTFGSDFGMDCGDPFGECW